VPVRAPREPATNPQVIGGIPDQFTPKIELPVTDDKQEQYSDHTHLKSEEEVKLKIIVFAFIFYSRINFFLITSHTS
jgi:hypothetical protein